MRKEQFNGHDDLPEPSDRPLEIRSSAPMETDDGSESPSPPPLSSSSQGQGQGQGGDGGGDGSALCWLRALGLQVTGACRADERLKPLLKLNFSCGAAEDRFILHLSQHFEASEIGMLARCLCVPLVSVRVGKVEKQGHVLCPTNARGNLNLGLLPSSSMRITFAGDDGHTEQLALVTNDFDGSEVRIEEISADTSGRSFLLKLMESKMFYYWCAERSRQHGMELIAKMQDLLERRATLSHLTGISNSRLDGFAAHLRAYLLASSIGEVKSMASLTDFLYTSNPHDSYLQSSSIVSKSSRFRASAANTTKASPVYQASLSPRSSTFKDGVPRTCIRSVVREKLKRRGECQSSPSTGLSEPTSLAPASVSISPDLHSSKCEGDSLKKNGSSASLRLPDTFPSLPLLDPHAVQRPLSESTSQNSLFKPYYCWCPPCPSTLQYSVTPLHLPVTSIEPLPLPPLSSLLSKAKPPASAVPAKLDTAADLPSLNLPALLHDPLLHLPLPTSSLVPLPGSQVPTFTPLMSDPIVHIPVIDVCSSGQAYLVSAGPSMSPAVPLLPSLVKPLIPESESLVERSARETLMRLIASTPPASSPQLINMMPAIQASVADNLSRTNVNKQAVHASNQLLGTSFDVDAIRGGISAMELHLKSEVCGEDSSVEAMLQEEHQDSNDDCDLQHLPKKL